MAVEQMRDLVAGYAPGEDVPLGGHAALIGAFLSAAGAFCAWVRHSGRTLPERVEAGDLVLIAVATHKLSRVLAKNRVTNVIRAPFTEFDRRGRPAEVEERPRGNGLRRAIGELLICPYCLGVWIAAAFAAGLTVAPRPTRWIATVFTAQFGADVLHMAHVKLDDSI